jgi:hypothetical protein
MGEIFFFQHRLPHPRAQLLEKSSFDIGKELERVKWFLWHGNVQGALDTIEDVEAELDTKRREPKKASEGCARISR